MTTNKEAPRKAGRPRLEDGPKLPYQEVDRLLVEGELVAGADGVETRVWPSQRDVARRFEVAPSLVAAVAKQHRCAERKAAFQAGTPVDPVVLNEMTPADAVTDAASEAASPATGPEPAQPTRGPGRPRKSEAPLIAYEELDRLLVFGEVTPVPGGGTTAVYPTVRVLAARYGVAPSIISNYAKHHNCARRREQAKTRIALRVDDKIVEKRAEAIAVGKDDVLRLIDGFLLGFEKALDEGRVRTDNPTDVNTMVRLKEFIMGGADSRQEIHAALSLESLQQRYARTMRDQRDATPALSGVIDAPAANVDETEHARSNTELSARFPEGCSDVLEDRGASPAGDTGWKVFEDEGADAADGAPTSAPRGEDDEEDDE